MEKIVILTEQEAKEYEKYQKEINQNWFLLKENKKLKHDIDMYRSKDTPKLKIRLSDGFLHCPVCGYVVDYNIPPQSYCDRCGQRLRKHDFRRH